MSTNTIAIQSYREMKPVLHREPLLPPVENSTAQVINLSDRLEVNYAGLPTEKNSDPSALKMPPLVRAYFKGRDNDPL